MTRLFVASWPPPDVAKELADLLGATPDGLRPVPRDHLHVTLRFIGDADADTVAQRLDGAILPAVIGRFGPQTVWLGERQLVVPVEGAEPLATVVEHATRGLGSARRNDFVGHVTLARSRRGERPDVAGTPTAGTFPLDDVRLVASSLEPGGAVYTTIKSYRPT